MFTGLVQGKAVLTALQPVGGDIRLTVHADAEFMADVRIGDSISVSGVCLTALTPSSVGFSADVSGETLRLTTLGGKAEGAAVNLEKSLLPSTRLGGHFVSGHVDGVGQLAERDSDARSWRFRFRVPAALLPLIAVKGSIAVDGVSLTVNEVFEDGFAVNLIPHTLAETSLGELRAGDPVNIEVDLIARYLQRLGQFAAPH